MGPLGFGVGAALGAIQGATEFLPVSSDGHLALGAFLFGATEMSLTMVVLLHAGTLLATLLIFGRDLVGLTRATLDGLRDPKRYLASDDGRLVVGIVAASIPTAAIGLVLEDAVESWAHVRWIVGVCLLASAGVVASTKWSAPRATRPSLGALACAAVGVAQGLAVLPGLSRSACTIACAMALGLAPRQAFRFSFLMSLPAVGGAVLLKVLKPGALAELTSPVMLGAAVAFVVGLVALRLLAHVVSRGRFWAFAVYLIPVGLALIVWDVLR